MNFLTPSQVIQGYTMGVFPMAHPEEDNTIYWYEPKMRGILPLDGLKVSKSLRKRINKHEFKVTLNEAFDEVMKSCARRDETWISEEIRQVYGELHKSGWAHSIECWKDGNLVGGLYGVAIKRAFFGESMFHLATDASKVALYYLVEWLKGNKLELLDMQYLTPHLESLGGIEISQKEYLERLSRAMRE
ncbi:MAG: leucyl/phenylalanyl-tRNA--protein transferase [Bacteroidetes bacterium]|nr:leucyl/phenylalanyl-tRNA--protein transferase [Bacteroidota bacterium]